MQNRVLLDTCALIWLVNGEHLAAEAKDVIETAGAGGAVFINPMSAWEVGMLASKGRLSLSMSVPKWFNQIIDHSAFQISDLNIAPLIESTDLPGSPPNDPVDRMMIALSRDSGMPLVTRDRKIIDYASAGYLKVITC